VTQHAAAARFIALDTYDVRFPTSRSLDGSDAMNPDPDYSAAYLVLRTDADDALEGHGFTFTIGRGNDVQVAAIRALREHVVGRSVDEVTFESLNPKGHRPRAGQQDQRVNAAKVHVERVPGSLEHRRVVQPSLHEAAEQDRKNDGVRADRDPDTVHTGKASGFRAVGADGSRATKRRHAQRPRPRP